MHLAHSFSPFPINRNAVFDLGDALTLARGCGNVLDFLEQRETFSTLLTPTAERHIFEERSMRLPTGGRSAIFAQAEASWGAFKSGSTRLLGHLFLSGAEKFTEDVSDDTVFCQPDPNWLLPISDSTGGPIQSFWVISPSSRGGARITTVLTAHQVFRDRSRYIPAVMALCRVASTSADYRQRVAASLLEDWFQPNLRFPPHREDFFVEI